MYIDKLEVVFNVAQYSDYLLKLRSAERRSLRKMSADLECGFDFNDDVAAKAPNSTEKVATVAAGPYPAIVKEERAQRYPDPPVKSCPVCPEPVYLKEKFCTKHNKAFKCVEGIAYLKCKKKIKKKKTKGSSIEINLKK